MSHIKIGWAVRDVSTDKPVNIPGQFHMRISKGILDPVTVTALVIDDGDDLVCMLSADLVVIRCGLLDLIRAKTAELLPAFPVEKIFISATHTHAGPSHYSDSIWEKPSAGGAAPAINAVPTDIAIASGEEYRDFLATQAAQAAAEAYQTRASGGLAWGYGFATVAFSRRVTYFDDLSLRPGAVKNSTHSLNGHAAMYGETNDPMFAGYEAGSDSFVNLLYTFDAAGKLTGAVINVPCPSQNDEGIDRLSASFWHDVRELIHRKHGNIPLLCQCAAAGDLSPRQLHYRAAENRRYHLKYGDHPKSPEDFRRRDIAERISGAFDEVLAWARKDIRSDLPVIHQVETVMLSRRLITRKEYDEDQAMLADLNRRKFAEEGTPEERLHHDSILAASRNRCRQIIERYQNQDAAPELPMEMHVVRIGDIAFATNRFELYMDYMHRIQARSPFEQTFIVQLAGVPGNHGGSYLATERGESGRGYSASRYCNVVSAQGGQQLVNETIRILKGLKAIKKMLFLILAILTAWSAEGAPLKIGWASRDVSTREPVGIRGQFHLRISEGVLDPLSVTALVIEDSQDAVVFLSADAINIRNFLMDMIRERVAKAAPEIPLKKIVFNATHTHAGGDLYEKVDSFPCEVKRMPAAEYQAFFADQAANAIVEAWKKRAPGGVAWGYGYAVVGYSRRSLYLDDTSTRPGRTGSPGFAANGHCIMYGNTNDDQFAGYEAGADPFVNLLFTFDAAGKLTGAIINVPSPSQNSEGISKLSADFWHDVRLAIRREHGDIFILPQCAAAGDLAPHMLHYQKAQERRLRLKYGEKDQYQEERARKDIAERIADAFDEVYSWAKKDIRTQAELKHSVTTISLSRLMITPEEAAAEQSQLELFKDRKFATEGTPLERLYHDSSLAARRARFQQILDRYQTQRQEPKIPMELHVIRLGDIAFATNRFELYMDYMHRIQGRSPFEQTFVTQLAGSDGTGGYLATERGKENRGYSANHYSCQVSPEGGRQLVEETVKTLKELAK